MTYHKLLPFVSLAVGLWCGWLLRGEYNRQQKDDVAAELFAPERALHARKDLHPPLPCVDTDYAETTNGVWTCYNGKWLTLRASPRFIDGMP